MAEVTLKDTKTILFTFFLLLSLLCIPLLTESGHSPDISTQQKWGSIALDQGLSEVYQKGEIDYLPLYLYILKLNAWLHHLLFGNLDLTSSSYNLISKIVPILANIMLGAALFLNLHKSKKSRKLALVVAGIYLFNLAIIYNTAYWGQVDSVLSFLMILSILFASDRNYLLSALLLSLAILTKIQAVFLLPLIALIIFRGSHIKDVMKIFLGCSIMIILVFLPYLLTNTTLKVLNIILHTIRRTDFITVNAYNFWYFVASQSDSLKGALDNLLVFKFSVQTIGTSLFFIYALLVVYQLSKNFNKTYVFLAASSLAFAFFMLATRIHERYLFYFFPFFAFVAVTKRRYLVLYITLMFTYLFNLMMVLHYGGPHYNIFYPIQLFLDWLIKLSSFNSIATTIALINVIAFIYFSWTGIFKGLVKNLKKDFLRLKPLFGQLIRTLCRHSPF